MALKKKADEQQGTCKRAKTDEKDAAGGASTASSGTASSTAAEQQSVAANGAPTPIPTDAGQPSVSASVANKSTVAASGASIATQQALGISAEGPRTKRQNNGSSAYQGPTCFQITAVDFYGAQCTARGWHRAIHQVHNILHNDWCVVVGETSDLGVYMRRLAEGVFDEEPHYIYRVPAITINYPDREPNKYSPIFDTASVTCRLPSLGAAFPTRPFNWGVDVGFFQDVSRVPSRQTNLVVRCVRQSVVYGNNAVCLCNNPVRVWCESSLCVRCVCLAHCSAQHVAR